MMAKPKAGKGVQNKALLSRVSYLYQAAAYLAQIDRSPSQPQDRKAEEVSTAHSESIPCKEDQNSGYQSTSKEIPKSLSHVLLFNLRSVSQKAQLRVSPAIKRTVCKRCNTMLIDGSTCTNTIENKSKNGEKPWADVLVQKCQVCGGERRFPLGLERQSRQPRKKPHRALKPERPGKS